ncbi:hypothetical protein MHH52_13390 [Paenibacillus sp. FSL K6-0276]|uniref:hypothetical protein n=1 Tax=Paenibacillus sp. FSL K6-0276 TaxID=2921450 RepID=UPI0030EE8BAF
MSAFSKVNSFLLIAEPDSVEEKNLFRQPSILKKDSQGQYQIVNRNEGTFTLDEVNSATTNKLGTFITRDNNVRDNLLNEIANTYSNEL